MICRYCGAQMRLDDTDYNFKGCYDKYFECPNCESSCKVVVRFSKIQREEWHSENSGDVKDEVVRYNYHNDTVTLE